MSNQTIEEIAQNYPQVKELLEAYENCLEEIGNQRQALHNMDAIMTSMQNTINGLVQEVETLRPLLDKGSEMRQAQTSYYSLRRQSQSKKLNDAQRVLIEQQAREWLIASKIVEPDFDKLLNDAAAFRDQAQGKPQPPAEPDQPELL